jgi:peptidoglycan endopeptidase LytF
MKLLRTGVILFLLCLTLPAVACGGDKPSSVSRTDPKKIPTATLPANLPEPVMIEGMPTRAPQQLSGDTYVVESGDSLYAIAEKLGTTVDELMALNDLTGNDLSVGQVLRVPGSASSGTPLPTPEDRQTPIQEPTEEAETPAARVTPAEGQTEYVVQSGDNASDIAARFGVTIEELAAANGMTIDDLRSLEVGQVLVIPPASSIPAPQATESLPAEEATPAPE